MLMNRKRLWILGLAFLTALSVMGFTVGNWVAVNAQSSSYQDPGGRFEVAILPGYKMTPVAGLVVVESPTQDLAYTVTVRPKASDRYLDDEALAQVAVETVAAGSGLVVGAFKGTDLGVEIPWQGIQGKAPIFGTLFARQTNNSVLVLTLSATEAGKEMMAGILPELSQSLQPASQG